jgi:hypothetical protein
MMVSYQDTWLMESNNPWTVAGGKALTELRRAEHLSISELTVFEDFFFFGVPEKDMEAYTMERSTHF